MAAVLFDRGQIINRGVQVTPRFCYARFHSIHSAVSQRVFIVRRVILLGEDGIDEFDLRMHLVPELRTDVK